MQRKQRQWYSPRAVIRLYQDTIGRKLIEKIQTYISWRSCGRSEKEIKRRINIAKRTFQQKSKLLTSYDLSHATKIRLVKCYIWAIFLYGCETLTLTESIEKKITAFEMWIYRRISRTPWTDKVTNQHVLQKINIKSTELVQMIRTRKAKFYGHVRRHNSLQRVILEGKVEGKRGRGGKERAGRTTSRLIWGYQSAPAQSWP